MRRTRNTAVPPYKAPVPNEDPDIEELPLYVPDTGKETPDPAYHAGTDPETPPPVHPQLDSSPGGADPVGGDVVRDMGGPVLTGTYVEEFASVPPDAWQSLGDAATQAIASHKDARGRDRIVRYAARIEILQAYQFDGRLWDAPAWVDKNWLAWADADPNSPVRGEAGPALDVIDGRRHVGTARKGDWVVRQTTTMDDKHSPTGLSTVHDHLAVIPADEFSRLYLPIPEETA